jgi:hypothetical protein
MFDGMIKSQVNGWVKRIVALRVVLVGSVPTAALPLWRGDGVDIRLLSLTPNLTRFFRSQRLPRSCQLRNLGELGSRVSSASLSFGVCPIFTVPSHSSPDPSLSVFQ